MKTTLDLPDDLMRAVKIHAARHDRTLKDLISELIRRGLAEPASGESRKLKVRRRPLPVIKCKHAAKGGDPSPEEISQILLDQETEWIR